MKKLFLLFILLPCFFGQAQDTAIPDANFEKALIDLGIDNGAIDGKVLTANVSGITSLVVRDKDITDLTGLQDFLSLKDLNCSKNKLTSLDISKNTALTFLYCDSNQISRLDVSQNTALTNLVCDYNQISSLDITKNTGLTYLSCSHNQITGLDVTKNTALTHLICGYNQTTNLDVSKNTTLTYLECNYNQITSLDVSKNTVLTYLECNNNLLTSLNLKNGNNTIITGFNSKSNSNLVCIQVDNKAYFDANWSTEKDVTANYSDNCIKPIKPPVITATGNQTYCSGTSLKIVETITITSEDELDADAIYIQISLGYINGQDQLTLVNPTAHPNIKTSWDATAGKLKLHNPAGIKTLYTDFVAAIKDVEYSNSSPTPSGIRNFSITIGQANYLPLTDHYYQFVPSLAITWTDAKLAAENSNYYGLKGYLATILSDEEAQISSEQASGAGWIGGSDADIEGTWKWVTGPEAGTIMTYTKWNTGEPNQYLGRPENYAHITASGVGITGSWNDLTNTGDPNGNFQPKGYIVEFGGMPGDPILQISASTKITIPNITSTTPNSRCNTGNITLQATASNGSVYWYTNSLGGTPIATGNSFTIENLTTTTTYYVDATNGNCSNTPRTRVTATINAAPSITSTTPASRCDTGTVTLQAVASAGTINWYDAPTGGNLLGTGTSYTTTSIASTTTYYVDANTSSSCTSLTRTAITATVNNTPTITSTTAASRCDIGTVTLKATSSDGIINWYDANGNNIANGNSFITPVLNATTTYYVDAKTTECNSPKTEITATIYPIDKTTEEVILCQGTTAVLDASIPGMHYVWSPGGETSQTITVSNIGDYSVTISSPLANCDSKKDFKVIEHPKPVIKEIVVTENSAAIELENPEVYYEFSIDGMLFTDSNLFSRIPSGQYTAFVREKNGCNLTQQDFSIFSISKYFTPNNDGFNDVWEIKEMKNFPNSRVEIFNRYGKLLKQLNYGNSGWNGTFNGLELPADDYWYVLNLGNGKPEIKGHFSIKR